MRTSEDGSLHYTRKTLPEEIRNCLLWPAIDETSLTERELSRVRRRRSAITAYLAGGRVAGVCSEFNISKSELLRALNRCVARADDGRIEGWRALKPGVRLKPYMRTAKLVAGDHCCGLAGALSKLFRDHPDVKDAVDDLALKKQRKGRIHEACISNADLHAEFLKRCVDAGIPEFHYPFNTEHRAARALAQYVRRLRLEHFARAAQIWGGPDAALRAKLGTGHEKHLIAEKPFDFCSNDAHRIDCIGTIRIPHPKGVRRVAIQRLMFLPIQEHYSEAVLGYHVVIRKECSAEDVVRAVHSALSVWRPRTLRIPGMAYPEGAGLPSGLIPEIAGAGWGAFLVDNASINLSMAVAERIRRRVGCVVNWGPVGQWSRRSLIENLFGILERRGFQRMPSTTGSHPKDPRKSDPAAKAIELEIDYEELLDLIDLAIATFNATPMKSLGMRSPLQVLREFVADPESGFLPRILPPLPPGVPDLDIVCERHIVRGNVKEGRRPYVEIDGAHYVNDVLQNAGYLIGEPLVLHIRESDLRTVEAYLPGGGSLGVLVAIGEWGRIPHDRATRKTINNLKDSGYLIPRPGESDISCYLRIKGQQALDNTAGSRHNRISKDATEVARVQAMTGLPVPEAEPNYAVSPASAYTPVPRPLPAFVDRPKHRAVTGRKGTP